jgi:UDP-2,4-diacetamido-2,4,6-trideoxy-beta-L-altropyranose hydrolase
MTKLNEALFICEAGSSVGFGHFMRCLALNEELKSRGWNCHFAMDRESLSQPLVKNQAKAAIVLPEGINTDPAEIMRVKPEGVDWLFIDHYEIEKDRISKLCGWARAIAWFQDVPEQDVLADLIIGYKSTDSFSVSGPQFIPLRAEIQKFRNSSPDNQLIDYKRLVIFFGGVDGQNLSVMFAQLALDTFPDWTIDVVLSSASQSCIAMQKMQTDNRQIKLHIDVVKPMEIMSGACFAIGAGGVNAFERCAIGLPSLVIAASGNQLTSVKMLAENGAASLLSLSSMTPATAKESLDNFKSEVFRTTMSKAALATCDGLGAQRIANIICEWEFI